MPPPKNTKFCDSWLVDGKFQSRLAEDEKSYRSAKCKLCMCTIELSNMGRHALTSYLKIKNKKFFGGQNKDSRGGLLKTWIQSSPKSTCYSDSTNILPQTQ